MRPIAAPKCSPSQVVFLCWNVCIIAIRLSTNVCFAFACVTVTSFQRFATRKEMEKQRHPKEEGREPKGGGGEGQSKVGGPSSHFCVVLLFSPLSFRVVLLGVVILSHRSLVWRFFPFLGGAVFSFGWCCFPPSFGWCCFRSSPSPLSGVLLSFFFVGVASSLNTCGCAALLLLLQFGAAFLSWVALPSPPSFLGGVAFFLFALSAGGALPPPSFPWPFGWYCLVCSFFWWCCLPFSHSGGADLPVSPGYHQTRFSWPEHPSHKGSPAHLCLALERERESFSRQLENLFMNSPLCVSPETFWTANLQRVVATSSSERSEGGRLGEAETLAQFQAFLDKKILPAEERVRCVRLVEVWNIVKSPRHPSLVLACPHEQIPDEDGIGEEAVKNLDKRTSGSNQRTERFLERSKSS